MIGNTDITRHDFLKTALAALGFAALPGGRLFSAPYGWKHKGEPNLVFGVISDTHLRTTHKSNRPGKYWPDKYFRAALEYFRSRNVDAVMNCGDMAHRGQTVELKFHADVWFSVFPGNLAPDGHEVVKLFVTGNHDAIGADYGDFVKKRYPDPVERTKHVLATDMAANWNKIRFWRSSALRASRAAATRLPATRIFQRFPSRARTAPARAARGLSFRSTTT